MYHTDSCLDGAYFGTSVAGEFFLNYPEMIPQFKPK